MKRIVTLTMNPAVDCWCETDEVRPVHKVRTHSERFDPGGGGINAARVVNELGGRAFAVYLAGGPSGDVLDELVRARGIAFHRIPIAEPTRVSHVVFERLTGAEYRFTPQGPAVTAEECRAALEFVEMLDFDYLIMSGSLPPGLECDVFRDLAEMVRQRGQKLVVDSSGKGLEDALESGVHLVKPSLGELSHYLGREPADDEALERHARELVRSGACALLAVTLGRNGALLASAEGVCRAKAPEVKVRSAVGAGDSFVGAMTLGLARGDAPAAAFRLAIAAGAATAMTAGTELCHRDDVERLLDRVKLVECGLA